MKVDIEVKAERWQPPKKNRPGFWLEVGKTKLEDVDMETDGPPAALDKFLRKHFGDDPMKALARGGIGLQFPATTR